MENPTKIILEAIARQLCVAAVYNQARLTLAPHILYTRHDDLFVDAVTIKRNGGPPKELKLGTFKCSGLHELTLTAHGFEPFRNFDPKDEKYGGSALFSVAKD